MRVAFVGKGGSGKTTYAALFSRYLASQHLPVLAIDADINQHLAVALGFSEAEATQVPALGLEVNRIKDYLRGTNPRISSTAAMVKTTPPGSGSRLLRLDEDNPLFSYFERHLQGVRLLATGPFTEEDLGIKCYHSKTGAVELLLNHLVDGAGEYVVVDMTAGADSFASGLFTKFDLTFLVAEPTSKAVSVYRQYTTYARKYDVKIGVIGNKVESVEDVAFLREQVGENLLTWLRHSAYVRAQEQGQRLPFSCLEPDNTQAFATMQAAVDACEKDWERFSAQMGAFHHQNAVSWANASVGEDLTQQIDPQFRFDPAVMKRKPEASPSPGLV